MGVCPKCGKEIVMINNWSNVYQKFIMTLDDDEDNPAVQYEETTDYDTGTGHNTWCCPKCDKEIANSEEEARKILMRKKAWSVS